MAKYGFSADRPWPPAQRTRCERIIMFRNTANGLQGAVNTTWEMMGGGLTALAISPFFESEDYSDVYSVRWACCWAPNASANPPADMHVALVAFDSGYVNPSTIARLSEAQYSGVNNDGGDITDWWMTSASNKIPRTLSLMSVGDGVKGPIVYLSEIQVHRLV